MPACTACGNHLTTDYVRVFGDNDGAIDECPHCPPAASRRSSPISTGAPDTTNGRDESADSGRTEPREASTERAGGEDESGRAVSADGGSLGSRDDPSSVGRSTPVQAPERSRASREAVQPAHDRFHTALSSVLQALR